jgi:hypothetical protein
MVRTIPTSLGLLTLSVFASGCSDANKVASALEKVCKAECDCPESDWDEVANCKDACHGYSLLLEAYIKDNAEDEPCATLDDTLKKMKDCTKESCGDSRDTCMDEAYYELYQCWDFSGGGSYYYPLVVGDPARIDIVQQLLKPIPGALDSDTLHSAAGSN